MLIKRQARGPRISVMPNSKDGIKARELLETSSSFPMDSRMIPKANGSPSTTAALKKQVAPMAYTRTIKHTYNACS